MSRAREFFDAHQFAIHGSPAVFGEWILCSCGWGNYETRPDDFDWEPVKQDHLVEELDWMLGAES